MRVWKAGAPYMAQLWINLSAWRLIMAKRIRTAIQDRRNEELASIALDLFAQHGFFGVSIKQIGARRGQPSAHLLLLQGQGGSVPRRHRARGVGAHDHYLRLLSQYDDPLGASTPGWRATWWLLSASAPW